MYDTVYCRLTNEISALDKNNTIARCFSSKTVAQGCVGSLSKNRESLWSGSLSATPVPMAFTLHFHVKKSACRHISGLLSIYMYMYTYIHIHVRVTTLVTCMYMYMYMTRACMLWAGIPCFYSTTTWEPVTLENTPQLFYSLITYK